jgi:hypothetical protein
MAGRKTINNFAFTDPSYSEAVIKYLNGTTLRGKLHFERGFGFNYETKQLTLAGFDDLIQDLQSIKQDIANLRFENDEEHLKKKYYSGLMDEASALYNMLTKSNKIVAAKDKGVAVPQDIQKRVLTFEEVLKARELLEKYEGKLQRYSEAYDIDDLPNEVQRRAEVVSEVLHKLLYERTVTNLTGADTDTVVVDKVNIPKDVDSINPKTNQLAVKTEVISENDYNELQNATNVQNEIQNSELKKEDKFEEEKNVTITGTC